MARLVFWEAGGPVMANIFSFIKVGVIETPGLQFENCHLIIFLPFLFVCLLVLTVDL